MAADAGCHLDALRVPCIPGGVCQDPPSALRGVAQVVARPVCGRGAAVRPVSGGPGALTRR
eukprot:3074027-Lingulodinium_polyedra.AAC.1